MDRGLALTHSDGFHEDIVVTCSLAEHYGLASLAGHASERACGGGRTDECIGMLRAFLHSRLVAEDGAARTLTARVDGKYGELAAIPEHMQTEHIDRRRLTGTGDAGYADTPRIS